MQVAQDSSQSGRRGEHAPGTPGLVCSKPEAHIPHCELVASAQLRQPESHAEVRRNYLSKRKRRNCRRSLKCRECPLGERVLTETGEAKGLGSHEGGVESEVAESAVEGGAEGEARDGEQARRNNP